MNHTKTTKILINLAVFTVLILPAVSLGADAPSLVPCGRAGGGAACDWNGLMALINGIINFVLFKLAIPVAAIMFAYAGFLMVTAGGGEGKTKAKEIFGNAVFGLLMAAAAWLIISTVLSILGYDGAWIGLKIGV
jgi:hypothetical protein